MDRYGLQSGHPLGWSSGERGVRFREVGQRDLPGKIRERHRRRAREKVLIEDPVNIHKCT